MTDTALMTLAREWATMRQQFAAAKDEVDDARSTLRTLERKQESLKEGVDALFRAAGALKGIKFDSGMGMRQHDDNTKRLEKELLALIHPQPASDGK